MGVELRTKKKSGGQGRGIKDTPPLQTALSVALPTTQPSGHDLPTLLAVFHKENFAINKTCKQLNYQILTPINYFNEDIVAPKQIELKQASNLCHRPHKIESPQLCSLLIHQSCFVNPKSQV